LSGESCFRFNVQGYPVGICLRGEGPACGKGDSEVASLVNSSGKLSVRLFDNTTGGGASHVLLPFLYSKGIISDGGTVYIAGENGMVARIIPEDKGSPEIKLYRGEDFFLDADAGKRFVPGVPFLSKGKLLVTYHSVSENVVVAYSLSSSVDGRVCDVKLSNRPNPFNPATRIEFRLARKMDVSLRIYDVSGRLIKTIHVPNARKGKNVVEWDGTDSRGIRVSSGVYFCRLKTPRYDVSTKMVLLR